MSSVNNWCIAIASRTYWIVYESSDSRVVYACAIDPLVTFDLPGPQRSERELSAMMAGKIALMLFGLVMMVVGGMIALLMIVWEMITHPFTVFKKIPRNGEPKPFFEENYYFYYIPSPNQQKKNSANL